MTKEVAYDLLQRLRQELAFPAVCPFLHLAASRCGLFSFPKTRPLGSSILDTLNASNLQQRQTSHSANGCSFV